MNATQDLKNDHIIVKRLRNIVLACSNKLYADEHIPIEDIEIISVVIEEFIDHFHHGKEEKAYFPNTKDKDGFSEDVRKLLIEHELGRRIANMLRRELNELKRKRAETNENSPNGSNSSINEPVARFLKSYAAFIDDHTGKEDKFFDIVEDREVISDREDEMLLKHYELCKKDAGGDARMEEMIRLVEYLEKREWMEVEK